MTIHIQMNWYNQHLQGCYSRLFMNLWHRISHVIIIRADNADKIYIEMLKHAAARANMQSLVCYRFNRCRLIRPLLSRYIKLIPLPAIAHRERGGETGVERWQSSRSIYVDTHNFGLFPLMKEYKYTWKRIYAFKPIRYSTSALK